MTSRAVSFGEAVGHSTQATRARDQAWNRTGREISIAAGTIAASTVIALLLRPHMAATNLVMVYLLGVVVASLNCRRQLSIATCFLSVAAFDFFCVPPYLTFTVSNYEYVMTFLGMLVVALVISTQTDRIRRQAADASERRARTETLYHLSRRLAGQARAFDIARTAAECAAEVFETTVVIFLAEDSKITFARRTSDLLPLARAEETVAQFAFDRNTKAGVGTEHFPNSAALYVPLRGAREAYGVIALLPPAAALSAGQVQLIEMFAGQTASAIEVARNQAAAEAARVRMQTEEMRSSLLSAVSHDLRTPLASITGAASALRSQGAKLPPETRHDLLESIADEADRLNRLVGNLLDMTRLESGVELRRDAYPIEEIVGTALQRMEPRLGTRRVTTDLPDTLPLVSVDDVLIGQLLANLLENAIKYTPEGTTIEIAAEAAVDAIVLEVRDRGPGFTPGEEQLIFEKFYRGRTTAARGVGLGLAICRAVVEAHRGSIEAFNRPGGGAVFRIRLPL